jgi:hypothetical protein
MQLLSTSMGPRGLGDEGVPLLRRRRAQLKVGLAVSKSTTG